MWYCIIAVHPAISELENYMKAILKYLHKGIVSLSGKEEHEKVVQLFRMMHNTVGMTPVRLEKIYNNKNKEGVIVSTIESKFGKIRFNVEEETLVFDPALDKCFTDIDDNHVFYTYSMTDGANIKLSFVRSKEGIVLYFSIEDADIDLGPVTNVAHTVKLIRAILKCLYKPGYTLDEKDRRLLVLLVRKAREQYDLSLEEILNAFKNKSLNSVKTHGFVRGNAYFDPVAEEIKLSPKLEKPKLYKTSSYVYRINHQRDLTFKVMYSRDGSVDLLISILTFNISLMKEGNYVGAVERMRCIMKYLYKGIESLSTQTEHEYIRDLFKGMFNTELLVPTDIEEVFYGRKIRDLFERRCHR